MTAFPRRDRDSEPWWDALSRDEFRLQSCRSCGTVRWAPRALCPACSSFEWDWTADSGHATVTSWIVTHRAVEPDRETPYVVVLGALESNPGVLIPGTWHGDSLGRDLSVGAPVRLGSRLLGHADDGSPHAVVEWQTRSVANDPASGGQA